MGHALRKGKYNLTKQSLEYTIATKLDKPKDIWRCTLNKELTNLVLIERRMNKIIKKE